MNSVDHKTRERVVRRICVLGASLDVGNRGVLALGTSVADLFASAYPFAEIAFHYGHQSGGLRELSKDGASRRIQVFNCRLSPRSRLSQHIVVILALAGLYRLGIRRPATRNPWLASLLRADVIGDIRGGDSFSDIYGLRRFLEGSLPLLSVLFLGRPFIMLPQTYGPFRSRIARAVASLFLKRAQAIFTRDRSCEAVVADLCGRQSVFCPDVAFTLGTARPAGFLAEAGEASGTALVGLNVSGLLYMGGYTGRNMFGLRSDYKQLILQLIERLLGVEDVRILLVPHVFDAECEEEATNLVLGWANDRFPGRVMAITQPLSERELKWIIGQTHFFVGSRMHACIAALSQAIPAVGLAYSDKFLGVFASADVADTMIDLRRCDATAAVDQIMSAFVRRAELKRHLNARVPAIKAHVRSAFQKVA